MHLLKLYLALAQVTTAITESCTAKYTIIKAIKMKPHMYLSLASGTKSVKSIRV